MTTSRDQEPRRDYAPPILVKHATLKDITLLTSGFSHHGVDK